MNKYTISYNLDSNHPSYDRVLGSLKNTLNRIAPSGVIQINESHYGFDSKLDIYTIKRKVKEVTKNNVDKFILIEQRSHQQVAAYIGKICPDLRNWLGTLYFHIIEDYPPK